MSNVFHELGQITSSGIKNLIASVKSANNLWTGINAFRNKVDIGTDDSIENGASLTVGTENIKQELSVHGRIKQDNQAIGTFYDFISGVGQIRANIFPQATTETLPEKPRIGEVWFVTDEVAIVVWDGSEWVPIGGGPKSYFLTVQAGVGGVASNEPPGVIHDTDSNIQIIAQPDFGYQFDYWSGVDENFISAINEPIAYVNMGKSFIATANFKIKQYILTVEAGEGGIASIPSGETEFDFSSLVEISASPSEGYEFTRWTGGTFSEATDQITRVLIEGDMTVTASFQLKNYFLEVIAGTGGTASGSGNYDHFTQAAISAAPDVGYEFSSWSGIGILDQTLADTTVDMVSERSVTANFVLKQYLLTVAAGTGGTATGGGTFDHFTQAPIEAVPDEANGYEFLNWTGDGVASTTSATTTVDMVMERSVTANFKLKDYTLSVTSGSGGTAESLDANYPTYQHGSTATIEATPDGIHDFDVWTGGTVGDAASASTSVGMFGDVSVTATFKLKQYLLTVQVSSPQGAGIGGSVLGGGTFEHYTQAQVQALPDTASGYEFDYWSGQNVVDTTINPTTVDMIGTSTVVANFKLMGYLLTIESYSLSAGAAGGGTTSGGGTVYEHGSVANITATPDQIHDFVNWTGGIVANANVDTTTTTMTGALTLTANFQYKTYVLTVLAGTGGTASGSGTYSHFDTPAITATPGPTPDGEDGYEFDNWTITSGDSTITDTTLESTTATVLGESSVTANFKLKDYTIQVGAKFKGKISIGGYYPLYATANEANADPDGDGTNHTHDINGVTYFMPNGLTTFYHGTHTIPWGDLSLYDEENPGDPTTGTGPWGTTPVTKQHGTDGWYIATPAQYHVFDEIEADSRWTLPWLDEYSEAGPVQIRESLNFIANFSLLQYKLYVIHYPYSEWNPNCLAGASSYWGDIEVNGSPMTISSGSGANEEIPGLIADGVWTSGNVCINLHGGDFDAFSEQTIKAIPKTADGYGFIEWVEPSGQNLIADRQAAETTITITPEGDNTNAVEAAARFGKLPISTFLTEGDLYFGSTINFTDVSTAPSGDGKVVSAEYTLSDSSLTLSSRDTAVRLFREYYSKNPSFIEIESIDGNSNYAYGDLLSGVRGQGEWSILVDMQDIQPLSTSTATLFARGQQSMNWYTYQSTSYMVDKGYVSSAGASIGATSVGAGGIQYTSTTSAKLGPVGKLAIWCDGVNVYTSTLSQTKKQVWYDPNTASPTYNQYSSGSVFQNLLDNASSPSTDGDKLRLFGSDVSHPFSWSYNHHSKPGLYQDIAFLPRALTTAEINEWKSTNIADLSFWDDLDDHIICGKPGTYPDLNGEKGKVVAKLVNGNEGQFKSLASLTLPDGSPGDTTGSIDVTLTVTDDQGLTDTETQPITYGPAPLESGDVIHSITVTADDGNELLRPALFYQADITSEAENNEVFTFTASSSGEQLSSTSTGQGPNEITEQTYT
jgi:hypothetical protein